MDLRGLVLIALFGASGILAAPTDSSRCAGECAQVYNPKFDFAPGKTYTYKYESSTTLKLPGVTPDEPGLGLTAVAEISVITPCELALKLSNVQLSGSEGAAGDFKKAVEEKPLLFSFSDGRVNHVCPDIKDPTWSVNVKRGVLSTLQNTMDNELETRVREVDIAGQCDTHYEVTSNTGKSSTINKRKDLTTCTKRVGRITSLQGNTYSSFSRVQSPPVTNSTQNCAHVIANNIIQSVDCEEIHVLRLLARGKHGATAVAKTKLNFVKQSKGTVKNLPRKVGESSLLFDHTEEPSKVTNDVEETLSVVKSICDKTDGALKPEAANDFTRLTYLVRRLSADSIRGILQKLESGLCKDPKVKDTFLGAIKQAGTEGAVQVLVELLNNNRVSGRRARIWLTSLAFIQRPTSGTIEAVIPLIDSPKPDRNAVLSVSSLVHTFCRRNENCEKDKAVQRLIEKLGRHLGFKCKANDPTEEDRVIASLKAFGNIGHTEKFSSVIQDCIKDSSLPTVIRLSAIQAFRRSPEDENTRRILTHILEDHAQDTELRIASYLGLMRHPSSKTIYRIKVILDNEIVNQVNSFIWTHLKNLQDSKSPVNYEVRKLVKDITLEKKFRIDGRKFSKNYELSVYSDKINAGADLDTNIIFTPDSFVPRSASLNFTLDLFGHSVDLLEVEVRAANFEYLLEKYFGPTGTVTVNSREVLRSKLRDRWRKIAEGVENEVTTHDVGHRHRRDAQHNVAKLKQLQSMAAVKRVNKPEGSLSLKVFGNEIRWYDFHNLHDIYDYQDPYNLKDIFNQLATHKEVDVARNIMLLDATSTIPTVTGFPLRFDVNGTASVGLKLKSHFDIRQLLLRPRSADIKSLVQPSASVEIAGSLIIDGGVTRTGLKLASTLYSSVAVDGTFLLNEGEELTVKLDLPQPNMDIINIKSNLYVVDRDTERAVQPSSPSRYDLKGCSRNLGELLGVEFCTVISLPRPFINRERPLIPLGGPIEVGLQLRKVDPSLQGYHFTYVLKREKNPSDGDIQNTKFKWSFNTPGSKKDREYTLDYELNRVDKKLKLNLRTPRTKVGLNGDISISDTKREANLVLNLNDEKEYAFHGKTNVNREGDKTILRPTWEISSPGTPKIVLTGQIVIQRNKLEIDIKDAPSSESKPYSLEGHVTTEVAGDTSKMETDLKLVTPVWECDLAGKVKVEQEKNGGEREVEFSVAHGRPGSEKISASIKTKTEHKLDGASFHIHRAVEWKWSRYPQYNLRYLIHLEKNNHELENIIDIRWSDNFEDDDKRFLLEYKSQIVGVSDGSVEGQGAFKLIYPRRDINWELNSKLKYMRQRYLNYEINLKYAKDKNVKATLDWKNQSTNLLKYDLVLKVVTPEREILFSDAIDEKKAGEFDGVTVIQWQRGESVTLKGSYKNKSVVDVRHHEIELIIQHSKQPTPLRKYNAVYHNERERYQLLVQAVTPEKTHKVNIEANYANRDQITTKVSLNLPWIEGEANTKRSETEFNANMDFKTEKRRVVGSANVNRGTTPKTVVLDLKWDADRDNSKQLNLKAEITRPRSRVADVKAVLTLPSRVIKADVSYELPPVMFNGEHKVKANVEYAPDRKVDFSAKILIDKNQVNRRVSHGQVYINSKTTNELKIVYDTNLEMLPSENRFNAEFHIDRQDGSDLVLSVNHVRGSKKVNTKWELRNDEGKAYAVGLQGDWDVDQSGAIIGAGLSIKTPREGLLQDFEIVIREGLRTSPEANDLVHENRIRLGPGREFGLAVELKTRNSESEGNQVRGRVQVDTPFENYRTYKVDAGLLAQSGEPTIIKGDLEVVVGTGRSLKTELRFDKAAGGRISNINLLIDSSRVPGAFELTLSHNSANELLKTMSVTAKYGLDKLVRLEFIANNQGIEVVLTTPSESTPTVRAKLDTKTDADGKHDVEALIEWGVGKKLTAVGEIDRNANGKLTVDSEALGLSGVTVTINGAVTGGKKSLMVKFSLGPERDIEWNSNYEKRNEQGMLFIDTTIKINGDEFLKLKFSNNQKPTGNPKIGYSESFELEVHNPLVSVTTTLILKSEKGVNPTLKVCSLDGNQCLILESLFKINELDSNSEKVSSDCYVKFIVQRAPGDSRTVGVTYEKTLQPTGRQRSIKILWNEEEKKLVGYAFKEDVTGDKNKPGYNRKYQILLPSRTIEVRAEKTPNDNGYVYNLNALLDAVREPERPVTINVDVKRNVDGVSITRISRITIKHPELKNNIVITNELRLRHERTLFSQKTEFDITGRKLTIDLELIDANKLPSGFNITYLIGVRQESVKNLDFKIRGHRARTDDGRSFGFELYWLNKDGVPKTYTVFSEVDKVNQVINGMIRTPIRVFDWKGKYEKLEPNGLHGLRADLDFNYNNKLVRRAQIEYSSRPTINLKYYANPADINRMFRLHGGLVDDKNFELSAVHTRDGQTVDDLSFALQLNTSKLLFTRLKWRPGVLKDVRDGIDARSEVLGKGFEDAVQNFADLAQAEVADKTENVRAVVRDVIAPALKATRQRLATIREELKRDLAPGELDRLRDVLTALFSNVVDVEAVVNAVIGVRDRLREAISERLDRIARILDGLGGSFDVSIDKLVDYIASLPARIRAWRLNFRSRLPQIAERVKAFVANVQNAASEVLEDQYVSKALAALRDTWDATVGKVRGWLQGASGGVLGGDGSLYQRIKVKLYEYSERPGELPKIVKAILTAIRSVKEKIQEILQSLRDTYYYHREAVLHCWRDLFHDFQDNPDYVALVEELRAYRKELREKYQASLDDDEKGLKQTLREKTDDLVGRVRERLEYLSGKGGVYDPKNGLIEYYIPLNRPIESLRDLRRGLSLSGRREDEEQPSLKRALQRLKPYFQQSKIRELLPPFDGEALLIGNQHFQTFDNRFFDFHAGCSYVLTQDLVDDNFTVIVNFNREGLNDSVTVISDFHKIVIHPRVRVYLDGQSVELPVQIENTVVDLKSGAVRVKNNKGFTLEYDHANDFIYVNVNGFYFGKLGGLFGNFDNEPSNDFHQPDGHNTSSVDNFAKSWEVSQNCPAQTNAAVTEKLQRGMYGYDQCPSMFSSSWSTLEDCFDHVKPDHFQQVCLEEAHPAMIENRNYKSVNERICNVARAYIHICGHHNIQLESPALCR